MLAMLVAMSVQITRLPSHSMQFAASVVWEMKNASAKLVPWASCPWAAPAMPNTAMAAIPRGREAEGRFLGRRDTGVAP